MSSTPSRKVLVLAPYPATAPSTRFRIVQLQPELSRLGVGTTLHPFLSEAGYRTVLRGGILAAVNAVVGGFEGLRSVLGRARSYDVVLVQRGISLLFDRRFLDALGATGVPVVYDFDDAVFLPQERGRRWVEALRDPDGTTRAFCSAARVVLAGNDYLAGFAREALGRADHGRVRVLPSVVDTDRFVPSSRPHAGLPTLGWVGSDTTVPYLEELLPALDELARRVPHRLVVVTGSRRPRLPGVDFDLVRWRPEEEVTAFQGLDVGLYPLDDSPWSRGKCGFKAIQYLACGVPCVASPVGVLGDIVQPGETGLHASSLAEWVEGCARLLSDPAERTRMGEAGRVLVESSYSVRRGAPVLAAALEEAAER